ncbi:lasso RiPP family leader peptide-containing protein [Amycolatopsis rhizosphaerae]|uniref:Lasso RiPP family leader peptide-containing protein n=2 Tax=Amycolatopsis rhizosphaerae TaxID=2053003 RepID=A0A558C4X5_9PSEU|nr:lasso RiPP family leader peptide-containing protein [Amycolatopsis rhizosphaerae]
METATRSNDERGQLEYQAPAVIELGGVVELTNGNSDDDTADMKQYYY